VSRHPSLDDRFDPAIRLVPHDPTWAAQAQRELRRIDGALGPTALRSEQAAVRRLAGGTGALVGATAADAQPVKRGLATRVEGSGAPREPETSAAQEGKSG
jgi:hypothetical protein